MLNGKPLILGVGEILWDMLPSGKQLGGAPANFAFHAAGLGASGVVVSRVGDDALGREILQRLSAVQLDHPVIQVDPLHPTGVVDVKLDAAGVPTYIIREGAAWDFIEATPLMLDLARHADAVCYGTLGQRSAASRAAIASLLAATKQQCLRVFDINLRQHYYSAELIDALLGVSGILKLNDQELPIVAKILGIEGSAATDVAQALFARFPLKLMALTRGPNGSVLFSVDGRIDEHPGIRAEIADTVGAGDAFTAALVTGVLEGHSPARMNEFANRLAAFVCASHGAMPTIAPSLLASR